MPSRRLVCRWPPGHATQTFFGPPPPPRRAAFWARVLRNSAKYKILSALSCNFCFGCLWNSTKYKILSALSCNFCSLLAFLHEAPKTGSLLIRSLLASVNKSRADPLNFGIIAQGPQNRASADPLCFGILAQRPCFSAQLWHRCTEPPKQGMCRFALF